jgi:hypothetical protein
MVSVSMGKIKQYSYARLFGKTKISSYIIL